MADSVEQEKIAKLKQALGSLPEEFPDLKDDLYLLMWLKGSKLDLEKTEQKIRKSMEWRKQTGIPQLDQTNFDPELDALIATKKDGIAKDGTAVLSFSFGATKMYSAYSKVTPEQWDGWWKKFIRVIEQSMMAGNRRRCANKSASAITVDDVQGAYIVCDFEKTAMMQYSSPRMIGYYMGMCKDIVTYYPDIARRVHFLNPPMFIVPSIKLVDAIIGSPSFSLVSHSGKDALEKHILPVMDRDQIVLLKDVIS